MCQIILVRPGQTDFDSQHRVQGSLDLPLNEGGQQEVQKLIDCLREQPIDLVLSGPNDPSHGTAELISRELDVPFKSTDLLKNVNQGVWEGLEIDEVKRKYPTVYRHWEDAPEEVSIPNAEPTQHAIKRIRKLLRKFTRGHKNLLIIAPEPLATLIACNVEGRKLGLQHYDDDEIKRCELQLLHRA